MNRVRANGPQPSPAIRPQLFHPMKLPLPPQPLVERRMFGPACWNPAMPRAFLEFLEHLEHLVPPVLTAGLGEVVVIKSNSELVQPAPLPGGEIASQIVEPLLHEPEPKAVAARGVRDIAMAVGAPEYLQHAKHVVP